MLFLFRQWSSCRNKTSLFFRYYKSPVHYPNFQSWNGLRNVISDLLQVLMEDWVERSVWKLTVCVCVWNRNWRSRGFNGAQTTEALPLFFHLFTLPTQQACQETARQTRFLGMTDYWYRETVTDVYNIYTHPTLYKEHLYPWSFIQLFKQKSMITLFTTGVSRNAS